MNERNSKFIILLMIACSWLPATGAMQVFAYFTPLILSIYFLLCNGGKVNQKAASVALVFLFIVVLGVFFNVKDFHPVNAMTGMLTYAAWLLLLFNISHFRGMGSSVIRFSAWLCLFQFCLGVIQLLIRTGGALSFTTMDAGDSVVGTLMDNSHLYVVKMLFFCLLFAIAIMVGDRRKITYAGFISSMLASLLGSALLTTALFLVALLIFLYLGPSVFFKGFSIRRLLQIKASIPIITLAFCVVFVGIQKDNAFLMLRYKDIAMEAMTGKREFGLNKIVVAKNSLGLLAQHPNHAIFGYGLGHYSSRAALITSGEYLRNQPSFIPVSPSEATRNYIIPYWNRFTWSVQFQDGVMNQPFFSLQSILMELGVVGLLAFFFFVYGLYSASKLAISRTVSKSMLFSRYALCLSFLLPFIILSENWLEYPHFAMQVCAFLLLARTERNKIQLYSIQVQSGRSQKALA